MRITISHGKTKAEAIAAVDRAVQDAFQSLAAGPVRITDPEKTWTGSVMRFSVTAQVGVLKNQVSGTAAVTDSDITIDVDLGLLGRLLPQENVRTALEGRIRGLLAS